MIFAPSNGPVNAFSGLFDVKNAFATGALPRTALGSLERSPEYRTSGEEPLPKNPTPALGLQRCFSALQALGPKPTEPFSTYALGQ